MTPPRPLWAGRLRTHRERRGWSVMHAAEQLRALDSTQPTDLQTLADYLRKRWEPGKVVPSEHNRAQLCRLYEDADLFTGIHESAPDALRRVELTIREDARPVGGNRAAMMLAELDHVRRCIDHTLSNGSVQARLDIIEERVFDHVATYPRTAPGAALEALACDIHEVQDLANLRQPALAQIRLSESTALLSLLIADALMKFGEASRATFWYGTARMAADDTHNLQLRALVRAQEAMLPYYFGRIERAVKLARTAQQLAPERPTDAVALAAAAEARSLARLGDRHGAEAALARAWNMAESIDTHATDQAFSFNDKRLLMYTSGTLTHLGETTRARDIQRQALDRYRANPDAGAVIDPVFVHLDAAVCDALDGAIDDACDRAVQTITSLPDDHRTKIVLARATAITPAIPSRHQGRRAVTTLRELLADTTESPQ